ncbi:MAG: DUF4968 domain-containing protein, partial [Bacteroidales bacterium]|nr:DUF4968 domain-containing protein [Bacteroidales bacterium]
MKRFNLLCCFIIIFFLKTQAQCFIKTDLGIKTEVDSIGIEIQFYSPSIVRVLKWPVGGTYSKESLSVIKIPQKTTFDCRMKGDKLSIQNEK